MTALWEKSYERSEFGAWRFNVDNLDDMTYMFGLILLTETLMVEGPRWQAPNVR